MISCYGKGLFVGSFYSVTSNFKKSIRYVCLPLYNDVIVSYSCNVLFPLVFNKCATISQTTLCSMQPAFIPLQIIYAFRCSLNLDVQIDILYIFYFGTKHTCANRTFITNYSHHCWGYQIFSPISNSESTKFVMISFSTGKLSEKNILDQ